MGKHSVFGEGPRVASSDGLFAEFQACIRLGIDPDIEFSKDRFSRMLNTGGVVADGAISSMRAWDISKDREREAETKRNNK